MPKKVLVVDDEKLIVKGLRFSLEQEDMEVDTAYDGEEAVEKAREGNYDIILLDLMLPKLDGLSACQQIREFSDVPIIMLTAKGEDMDKILGLEYGADDYITKPFSPLELVARVNSQLRRYTSLGTITEPEKQSNVFCSGGLVIDDDKKEVSVNGESVRLTRIEYNILLLLLQNKGKVFSIDQIYEKIWNEEAFCADNTVTVHIRHIREKIEIDPKNPKYLKVMWGIGYKVEDLPPEGITSEETD